MITVDDMRAQAECELEGVREDFRKQGLDPDALGVPKTLREPEQRSDENLGPATQLGAQSQDDVNAELENARAACAALGVDMDAKLAEQRAAESNKEEPKNPADELLEQLEAAALLRGDAGVPDEKNHALAKLNNPSFRSELAKLRDATKPAAR